MELAQAGPIAFADAFPRVQDGETAFYIADLSLQSVIERLAAASPPLIDSGRALTLTDTGRAVLAGEIDRVTHCGIDRWLGGVHLQGRCPTWRWNPGSASFSLIQHAAPGNAIPRTARAPGSST